MAANLTDYGAQQLLNYGLTSDVLTRPTSWFIGLNNANPTRTGSVGEIGAGVGYARVAVSLAASDAVNRFCANSAIVTIGPASGAGFAVAYMTLWDALSGGNAWWYGPITGKVVAAGDSYAIPAGFLTLTFPATNP
jgi:hypothetical protein